MTITSALDAIFTDDLSSFIPSLPAAWQNFATKHLLPNSPPPNPKTEAPAWPEGVRKIGGNILPPRLTHQNPPPFEEYARAAGIDGNCLIFVVVDQDGKPSHLSILRLSRGRP